MSRTLVWFFGRGLSIECGLTWNVPPQWSNADREEKIRRIKTSLSKAMQSPKINTGCISDLLCTLESRTAPGWRHLFLTTNWDHLLQRELCNRYVPGSQRPAWLANSHVYHLNGTVEHISGASARSPFLLPEDPVAQRHPTYEANVAYQQMIWEKTFVVVGMSFECETDRFLLHSLERLGDNLPIGESEWIVVNRAQQALDTTYQHIRRVLPCAKLRLVQGTFSGWQDLNLPELRHRGILQ
jgi:hypothetical protein